MAPPGSCAEILRPYGGFLQELVKAGTPLVSTVIGFEKYSAQRIPKDRRTEQLTGPLTASVLQGSQPPSARG